MPSRLTVPFVAVVIIALFLAGCTIGGTYQLSSIAVTPTSAIVGAGQTVQMSAIGTLTAGGNHPPKTEDITSSVTWQSSNPNVVTVNSSGLATGVASGTATITASSLTSNAGTKSATSNVTVAGAAGVPSGAGHNLTGITIIPATGLQSVSTTGETAQFIAIGSFDTAPTTQDITNQVTWVSADIKVATINSTGLATAVFTGKTNITAIATTTSGGAVTGISDLTVTGQGGVTLPTLTVYEQFNVGLGTGRVVSSPAGIDCTSVGGAGCAGNFVLNSTVTLTATPDPGSIFGGWSFNCQPASAPTTGGTCSLTMSNNDSVGAIFNKAP